MKTLTKTKKIVSVFGMVSIIALMSGCGTTPRQQQGMALGGLGGAAIGGAVGGWSGAAIGAAGGAALGGIVTAPRCHRVCDRTRSGAAVNCRCR